MNKENLIAAAQTHFKGDMLSLAEEYYRSVRLLTRRKIDLIGHFDLVTKYNAGNCLIDTQDKRYKNTCSYNDGCFNTRCSRKPYIIKEILNNSLKK